MNTTKQEDVRPECKNKPEVNQYWTLNVTSPPLGLVVLNIGRQIVPGCEGHIHVAFATIVYPEGVPAGEVGMKGAMPLELWALLERQNILTLS